MTHNNRRRSTTTRYQQILVKKVLQGLIDDKKNDLPTNNSDTLLARIESFAKTIGLILTSIALFLSYLSYSSAQKWKEAEFTSRTYTEYYNHRSVDLTLAMLDYSGRNLPLTKEGSSDWVDYKILYDAMYVHSKKDTFSLLESKIRDTFDEYFDLLSIFNRHVESNLYTYAKIKPYISYEVDIIANPKNGRLSDSLRHQILDYIKYYGFKDVEKLYMNIADNQ